MRPQVGGTGYEFLIAGVPESLDYYVEAGGVRSKQYQLNVVDLPAHQEDSKSLIIFPAGPG